jgi:hypothetical protein
VIDNSALDKLQKEKVFENLFGPSKEQAPKILDHKSPI